MSHCNICGSTHRVELSPVKCTSVQSSTQPKNSTSVHEFHDVNQYFSECDILEDLLQDLHKKGALVGKLAGATYDKDKASDRLILKQARSHSYVISSCHYVAV